jgi:hypothetical protein
MHNHFLIEYEYDLKVRFEVLMAVTTKNAIFWDVTPCGLVRTDVSEEHITSIIRVQQSQN